MRIKVLGQIADKRHGNSRPKKGEDVGKAYYMVTVDTLGGKIESPVEQELFNRLPAIGADVECHVSLSLEQVQAQQGGGVFGKWVYVPRLMDVRVAEAVEPPPASGRRAS